MLNIKSAFNLVSDSDLAYLFRLCVDSKFVDTNTVYRAAASKTDFAPDMDDTVINAYARTLPHPSAWRTSELVVALRLHQDSFRQRHAARQGSQAG